MRVGSINNNIINAQASKQNIAFQKKTSSFDETITIIKQANKALNKGEENPNKLRNVLKKVAKKLNKSELGKVALFDIDFAKKKNFMTKELKSGIIDKQKVVIKKIFKLRENLGNDFHKLNIVNNYFMKKVIPFVQETKNKELAEYILKSTEKTPSKISVESISERVELISELGSKNDIDELYLYTGPQLGFAHRMKQDCPCEVEKIGNAADKAIEKLSTNPNF